MKPVVSKQQMQKWLDDGYTPDQISDMVLKRVRAHREPDYFLPAMYVFFAIMAATVIVRILYLIYY